ncbi:MAG: hypothetical protein Q8K75_04670 [Chlamydiales bacterium]|nr:hypothetical protein [Chlamydiales bacterium]
MNTVISSETTFKSYSTFESNDNVFKKALRFTTGSFKNLTQKYFRDRIYPAASEKFKAKMDESRIDASHKTLAQFGAVFPEIITIDDKKLECVYCTAVDFREKISLLGGQFTYLNRGGENWQALVVHRLSLKTLLEYHGIEVTSDLWSGKGHVYLSKQQASAPDVSQDPVVAILTHGNASIIARDRDRFLQTLFMGMDVFSYNIRGTGHSSGEPGEKATYTDASAVFEFLNQEYAPVDMQWFGYCLGGPNASYIASQTPVHLLLDRCFCRIGDIFGNVAVQYSKLTHIDTFEAELLSDLLSSTTSWLTSKFIIDYSNENHVRQTKMSVCVISAKEDDVIPPLSGRTLWQAAPYNQKSTYIEMDAGHCDPWTQETREKFLKHQHTNHLLRSFGENGVPDQSVIFDIQAGLSHLSYSASALPEVAANVGKAELISAMEHAIEGSNQQLEFLHDCLG